jgi:hypothetical protein
MEHMEQRGVVPSGRVIFQNGFVLGLAFLVSCTRGQTRDVANMVDFLSAEVRLRRSGHIVV